MIQRMASNLTKYSIKHNWVDPSRAEWCCYAIEKRIGMLLFVLACTLIAAITDTWWRLFCFVLTFYLFRARLGGWHAKYLWFCQLLSIGIVVAIVTILGPTFEKTDQRVLISVNYILIFCTFILKPVYPEAAHFTKDIKIANTKYKNRLLIGLAVIQTLCLALRRPILFTYSFLGLVIADLSVILQICTQKKKGKSDYESD